LATPGASAFSDENSSQIRAVLMQDVFSRKKAIEMMGDGMKKIYRIKD